MKTNRGLQAAVLTVVFFCFVSGHVFAALSGDGTETNPYLIQSRADFDEFANPANAALYWAGGIHTKLMCNINLAGTTYTQAVIAPDRSYYPNGVFQGTKFTSVFDGNGHTITNLTINQPTKYFMGLFGYVGTGGQVKNLCVDVTITGYYRVGGLVGYNRGLITSCYMMGAVNGTSNVGGLVGDNYYEGFIASCYATGVVSGSSGVGGLVGLNSDFGTIVSCYATSAVTGTSNVGGLAGANQGLITSCYATGTVTGTDAVGGLVGENGYFITSCYAAGAVTGTSNVGGLAGANSGTITRCFWDKDTSGQAASAGGTGKTTVEMKTLSTFIEAGWDFAGESANGLNDYWQMEAGDYPRLTVHTWTLAGQGTAGNPYIIADAADLGKVWLRPSACYRLVGDLDLTGISWSSAIITVFTGSFDGQGFAVSNLMINRPGSYYMGLFGRIYTGSRIQNLGLQNVNIAGSSCVGGLVGYNSGSLTSCYATGMVTGTTNEVGGLVGENHGSMTSCYATGTVTGMTNYVGGLVGYNSGSLTSCYATGTVTGTNYCVGGLVGMSRGRLINSYATGAVTGTVGVGGLVGRSEPGSLTSSCYATGMVTGTDGVGGLAGNNFGSLTSCYATSAVTGTGKDAGGLVGSNGSGPITSCYATGVVQGKYSVGGLAGSNGSQFTNSSAIVSCYATGAVTGTSEVGGLTGANYRIITSCYAAGAVTGKDYVGGLAGSNRYSDGSITSCYATGAVTGTSHSIGGLVGGNNGSITSCYATGAVTGTGQVGGLVGVNWYGSITSCFWDIQTSGRAASAGGTGKTTAQMKTLSTFINAGWDFAGETANGTADIWFMRDGIEYPKLVALNCKPVADAGQDVSIHCAPTRFTAVQLDGSGSSDADNNPLSYHWSWKVEQRSYTADGVKPTIQLPLGTHKITLIVNNGIVNSDPNSVIVTVYNTMPIADAGQDVSVHCAPNGFAAVQLDGAGSSDADNDLLSYHWSWTIDAQSYTAEGVNPTIQLPLGVHTITLMVDDGIVNSDPNTVTVTVYNTAPVANAGDDITAYAGFDGGSVEVTLDGSGSVDDDGDALTYKWYLNQALLAEGVSPMVSLPAGEHTITLIVNNGIEDSPADEVVVTVIRPVRTRIMVLPVVLNLKSQNDYIWILMDLPRDIKPGQIDTDYGYFVLPGRIGPKSVRYLGNCNPTAVAMVSWDQLKPHLNTGKVELTFYSRLKDGRFIGGSGMVLVIDPPCDKPGHK